MKEHTDKIHGSKLCYICTARMCVWYALEKLIEHIACENLLRSACMNEIFIISEIRGKIISAKEILTKECEGN